MQYAQNGLGWIVACLLLASCHSPKEYRTEPLKVTVETVQVSNDTGSKQYVGTVEASSSTAVSFTGTGLIGRIYVAEGQHVTRGQLIAELDKTQANNLLANAQAQVKEANDVYNRMKQLYDNNSLAEMKWVEIQSKVEQAQAQFELAKKNLADCSIKAPVDGIIGKKHMNSGETALPSEPVCDILDIRTVKVNVSIPEKEIAGIHHNTPSLIYADALGKSFCGDVIEKGIQADLMTHTYNIRILVPNKTNELLPGMVCKVSLSLGNQDRKEAVPTITVPIRCVQCNSEGKQFVWIVRGTKAHRQDITVGETVGNRIVVTSGLHENDKIIVSGYQKVSEGTEVVP